MIVEVPSHLSFSQASNLIEEWRPVLSHPGWEASSLGRVRSWRRSRGTPKMIGSFNATHGYFTVCDGGVTLKVHRLVCETFNGPPAEGQNVCRHLNDVKTDNRPENLAWGTDADNVADKMRNGFNWFPGPRKLTEGQALEIRRRYDAGESPTALAREFEVVSKNQVINIGKRRSWRNV